MDKLVWKSFWENEPAPDDSQAMASGSSDSAAATPVPAGEPGAPALWLGPGPSPARQVRMAPLTRQCYRHRFFVARSELLAICLLGYSLVRVRFHYCYLIVAMASVVWCLFVLNHDRSSSSLQAPKVDFGSSTPRLAPQ